MEHCRIWVHPSLPYLEPKLGTACVCSREAGKAASQADRKPHPSCGAPKCPLGQSCDGNVTCLGGSPRDEQCPPPAVSSPPSSAGSDTCQLHTPLVANGLFRLISYLLVCAGPLLLCGLLSSCRGQGGCLIAACGLLFEAASRCRARALWHVACER